MRRFGLVAAILGLPAALWVACATDVQAARWCVDAGARLSCAFESRRNASGRQAAGAGTVAANTRNVG